MVSSSRSKNSAAKSPFWLSLLLGLFLPFLLQASDEDPAKNKNRSSIYSAFSRGDVLSWDQLEVVAKEAGISGNHLQELKVRDRVLRLIRRYRIPLEFKGLSAMTPEEEFRVHKGSSTGFGTLEISADFADKNAMLGDSDAYLTYLLFRAQAYFGYRSRYDPDHCTWIVREESEPLETSFRVLRSELNASALALQIQGRPADRDIEFRKTLDPTQDPARTLKKLVEFALRCIAQKASDNWALVTYRQRVGEPPLAVLDRVRRRERFLASDFGRARFAMTQAERMTFHRLLKAPFRYAETQQK